MKTSEVLNKAADLIKRDGWIQGDWAEGGLCLEGGIIAAYGFDVYGHPDDLMKAMGNTRVRYANSCPAGEALRDYLELLPYDGLVSDGLWNWNDSAYRTAEEVIEVLRACAVIEAAKEDAAVRESVPA